MYFTVKSLLFKKYTYIDINIISCGGSGGSTPDFQAGGSGFDSWAMEIF